MVQEGCVTRSMRNGEGEGCPLYTYCPKVVWKSGRE